MYHFKFGHAEFIFYRQVATRRKSVLVDKPGFVEDNHSSTRYVTATL